MAGKSGKIKLGDKEVSYQIRKYKKSRNIKISIAPHRPILVSIPAKVPYKAGEMFLYSRVPWIKKHSHKIQEIDSNKEKQNYLKHKEQARELITKLADEWSKVYGVSYNRISIRNQKTRWGSCTQSGNLNFSYKLLFLPEPLAEYVVIHELCHLKHLNHSSKFWDMLAKHLPDWKVRKQHLKNIDFRISLT